MQSGQWEECAAHSSGAAGLDSGVFFLSSVGQTRRPEGEACYQKARRETARELAVGLK